MMAKKNIRAGELILSEQPTMVGPPIGGQLICFNCCKHLELVGHVFCRTCGSAVLCNTKCTGLLHTNEECKLLQEANIKGADLAKNNDVIFPLRCIFLRKYKPEVWKSLMELEAHIDKRRNTPIWRHHEFAVEQKIRNMKIISDADVASELVQRICGLLDVNTFELRPRQNEGPSFMGSIKTQCLRGLYIKAALMAHDCTSNTFLSVDDDFVMNIKASVDIPKDCPIFFSYTNVLHGSVDRRKHLLEGKYFECTCKRCSDPTEANTDISSLKCHKCKTGIVRMKNTSTENSDWECSNCQKTFKNFLINLSIDEGRRKIQELGGRNDMDAIERLRRKLLQTFHENHFLILEIQQTMIGLYTYMPPTKSNLQKKIRLCQSLIEVFSKIEPGISRIKAMTLYQLQSSMIDLANKEYIDTSINLEELCSKLLDAEIKLRESIKYLLHEPPRSPEGRMAQMALSELKMLRTSIDNIKNDLLFMSLAPNRRTNNNKKERKFNSDDISPVAKDEVELKSCTGPPQRKAKREKKKNK